jgi:hypothetical protein
LFNNEIVVNSGSIGRQSRVIDAKRGGLANNNNDSANKTFDSKPKSNSNNNPNNVQTSSIRKNNIKIP